MAGQGPLVHTLAKHFFILIVAFNAGKAHAAPSIEITNVPAYGSFDNVGGRVLEASPAAYRVAVFIYVPNAGWYSKPYCITALLVSTNYNEPCVEGPPTLPTNVTAQAIASATVVRLDPNVRWISFGGYDWWVKASSGLVGPGPNYFSDSTNNLWLDGEGQLHLRITNWSNQWQCAELVTARTFGYGSYRFELASIDRY